MGDNLSIYNSVRAVPQEAQKPIIAGRLNGMTDINPMWRIKMLTEQFGPAGIGWYYEVTEKWLDQSADTKEVTANVMINLYVKTSGNGWSQPIQGIGGSKFVASERSGLYVSDECYKMALTDAISVACKALGMGADIYWNKDRTKYSGNPEPEQPKKEDPKKPEPNPADDEAIAKQKISGVKVKALCERCEKELVSEDKILKLYKVKSFSDLTERQFANINTHWEDIKKV